MKLKSFSQLFLSIILLQIIKESESVFCYKCESHRDFRCLDPFDSRPILIKNCDNEQFARDRKPVFCEKVTELIDGVYVTTRGCSTRKWEDIDKYVDIRNQEMRCIRRGRVETCLCTTDQCNHSFQIKSSWIMNVSILLLLYNLF